jgi:hypothetical protein
MSNCAWRVHDECAIHVIGRHFLDVPIGDIPEEYISHNKIWNAEEETIKIPIDELREHLQACQGAKQSELKRATLLNSLEFLLDKEVRGLITSDNLVLHLKTRLDREPTQKDTISELIRNCDKEIAEFAKSLSHGDSFLAEELRSEMYIALLGMKGGATFQNINAAKAKAIQYLDNWRRSQWKGQPIDTEAETDEEIQNSLG